MDQTHPLAYVIAVLLIALLGAGGRGFLLNLRKDKRVATADEATLLDAVREVARREVVAVADRASSDRKYYQALLEEERARVGYLELRINQLTQIMRDGGFPVPPWTPYDSTMHARFVGEPSETLVPDAENPDTE